MRFRAFIYALIIAFHFYDFYLYNYGTVPYSVANKFVVNNKDIVSGITINDNNHLMYVDYKVNNSNHQFVTRFSSQPMPFNLNVTDDIVVDYVSNYSGMSLFTNIINSIIMFEVALFIVQIIVSIISLLKNSSLSSSTGKNPESTSSGSSFPISLAFGSGIDSKSFFTVVEPEDIKITMDNVIGVANIKADLKEFTKYIKYPKVYNDRGCKLPRGILFTGPPGTGKTLLAKAFAGECEAKFIATAGSSFDEIYVGMGSKRVRELFKYARENTPCIIFIDEIDAIGSRSSSHTNHSGINATINTILSEMDGMVDADGIMCIAATNHPELLDKAIRRSGRFDKELVFDAPNIEERKKLFAQYLNEIRLDQSLTGEALDTLINQLAQRTAGQTGADIKNICNQAMFNHLKQYNIGEVMFNDNSKKDILVKKSNIVDFFTKLMRTDPSKVKVESLDIHAGCTEKDILEAIDDIAIGIVKRERAMNEREKTQVSYHESGHALVNSLLKGGSIPLKMSIIPRGSSALGFTQPFPEDKYLYFKNELLTKICVLLGGRIAEEIKCDDISSGASDDFEKASHLAHNYITKYSMDGLMNISGDNLCSDSYKREINDKTVNLLNTCLTFTRTLLVQHKEILEKLKVELSTMETMDRDTILRILKESEIEPNSIDIILTL